jgi:3-isopropylmalate/(R)-2-methylmalate dehydratase small subunit
MAPKRGRAWTFPANVSTDLIFPGRYVEYLSDNDKLRSITLIDAREDFAPNVKPGDFVVADDNFGMGSSREQAALMMRLCGLSAVVSKSFARIFFRNCINVGVPAIELDTSGIDDGDDLEIDLEAGKLTNHTKSETYTFPPLPAVMTRILDDGGLVAHIKKHGDFVVA